MEDIIIKDCSDQPLSPSEKKELETWLAKSRKNRQIYSQMKLALLYPASHKREEVREEVWADLKGRISPYANQRVYRGGLNFWLKAAAVIVLCFTVALTLYKNDILSFNGGKNIVEVKYIEKVSLPGQKITTLLADGTIVKLNADSKLIVPENFSADRREVSLQGEAFFDVARDEARPFIIHTKDIDVEVLGTSFNVRSYTNEEPSVVAVATGKVAVSGDDQRETLTPGQRVAYTPSTGTMIKGQFDQEEEFGWKENILLFQGKNLTEIAEKLSRWYGVEFLLEEGLEVEKQFSGRYKDPSLRGVLEGLSYVYGFKYEIEGQKVILK